MSKTLVVVGLGSNLNPLENLRAGLWSLKFIKDLRLIQVSPIYESDAQVLPNAPQEWSKTYLNAAVLVEVTNFDPQGFLQKLKQIEKNIGRMDSERWAPREIDLDILYAHQTQIHTPELTIPHQNLTERPFALLPALDVLPQMDVQRPLWAYEWFSEERPFRTRKSNDIFWPKFVGILNITTDSFSDGGLYLSEDRFKSQVQKLVSDGAEVLDFGAESTRPEADEVSDHLEFERLQLALSWLQEMNLRVQVSIDSRKPMVLQKLFEKFKIDFINDVTGFQNAQMLDLLNSSDAKGVVMHSLTIPPDQKNVLIRDQNPCRQLVQWWREKIKLFHENRISDHKIIFDPGIGFGKTPEQNFYILNHLHELNDIQVPTFLAFSRKSFLKKILNTEDNFNKDLATAQQLMKINSLSYQYLRTHDIESQKIALRLKNDI